MRVVFNSPLTSSTSASALAELRRLLAAVAGATLAAPGPLYVSSETALLCGALAQKAYLALESAEIAWQTYNIVALAIASRTLVETAAMVCALVDDPDQAAKVMTKPTVTGLNEFKRLMSGAPEIRMDSWKQAMSLAHPSPEAYRSMFEHVSFKDGTTTDLLGRWNEGTVAPLQRLCCDAGLRVFQSICKMVTPSLNEEFAAELHRARVSASTPANLESDVKDGIESLSLPTLALLEKCQSADVSRLQLSNCYRLRLFGLQYSVHCATGVAVYLQFANADAFVALVRSWIEACTVVRVFAESERSAVDFVRTGPGKGGYKKAIKELSARLPDIVRWYEEASAYPHASFGSLRPRLIANAADRSILSMLSPTCDDTRLKTWLPRALALAAAL